MRSKILLPALALMLVTTGLAGCNQDSRPKGWSDQWYREGQTPEEAAEWRRKHPEGTRRTPDSERAATPSGAY